MSWENHIAGMNQTLSSLSTKFWIVAAREAIIEWEKESAMYQRRKAKKLNKSWHHCL